MQFRQPQIGGLRPNAYWKSRGLQLVFIGNKTVWHRENPEGEILTNTGPAKSVVTPYGVAQGFASVYGTGLTDYIGGIYLRSPRSGARSVFVRAYPRTTGGGGFGRIYQATTGSGATVGEAFYLSTAPGVSFAIYSNSQATSHIWTPSFTIPTGRWCTLGISVPFSPFSATTATGYLDGKRKDAAPNVVAVTGLTANPDTNLAIGNRPTAPGNERYFDGMIECILVFDGFLTDKDHAQLDADPYCVFEPVRRHIFGASVGGVTLLPSSIASAEAFGTAAISMGIVTVSPSGITSGEAFGTAILSNGSLIIIPTGISSGELFGLPTVQPGTIVVLPTSIASSEGFGTASMLVGELVIYPSGIPSGSVFGIPNITGGTPSTATTVFYVRGFSSYGSRRNS